MIGKVAFLFFVIGCLGCTEKKPTEIVFGFVPVESPKVIQVNAQALAQVLYKKTHLPLAAFVSSDFKTMIAALRAGKVHVAFLPPFALIEAERSADAKVLLKAVRNGQPHFYSAIITAKPFKSIRELKGKSIAWTDPMSASGHIIPKMMLKEMGIPLDTFFSKQIFLGKNDSLVRAVAEGHVDAGATFAVDAQAKTGAWTQYLSDPKAQRKIRVLQVSPPIAGDTVSTTNAFYKKHRAIVDTVVSTLVDLGNTEEGRKILKDLYSIERLVPAEQKDYEPLRKISL